MREVEVAEADWRNKEIAIERHQADVASGHANKEAPFP
jgi:hypothetical protein